MRDFYFFKVNRDSMLRKRDTRLKWRHISRLWSKNYSRLCGVAPLPPTLWIGPPTIRETDR